MRIAPLLLALIAAGAHAAPARLTEAEVRGFVARQEKAWNAKDAAAFFVLFTPDAVFVDQGRAKDGRVVPYGQSTLAQARAQAARTFAKSQIKETAVVTGVAIAPDGGSARVAGREEALITTAGKTRRLCAETFQMVVLTAKGLRSKGQTDTLVACR
jgi:uncharacterized protein (TIGR02246 family)